MVAEPNGLRPLTAAVSVTIAVVGVPASETHAFANDLHREVVDVAVAPLEAVLAVTEPDRSILLMWSATALDPQLCERVARWADTCTPRLGLVACVPTGTTADSETALAAGFDDVVIGACSPRELAARLRAVHRRVHRQALHRPGRLRHAGMLLDTDGHELWIEGRSVALTSTELSVVRALMRARGRTLSRTELLDHAWGTANFEISERAVDNVVLRLRRKLGKPDLIETVRGVGFRLSTPDTEE